jgi:cell division protease FtsH
MSDKLGLMSVGDERRNVFLGEEISRPRNYSEETARLIDEEINQVLNDAYDRTYHSLEENRDKLDALANALIEREELEAEDVLSIVSNGFKPGSDQPESEDPQA